MAKAKSQPQAQVSARARRSAREADAERRNRLLIIGGVLAVVIIAVGFIAFGWYQTHIRPYGTVVLRVEDSEFTLGHLVRRMELEYDQTPLSSQGAIFLQLPDIVLDRFETEGKLLAHAHELNDITVTGEEVAAEIRERGNLAQDAAESAYADEVRRQVEESGLKRGEYEQMLRAQLLEEKVSAYFTFVGPTVEPQVRARAMVFDDEARANEALMRLAAGEDFAALAIELSLSGQTIDVDWSTKGTSELIPTSIEDFLFESQPGARSELVESGNYFYIAELLERDDARALSDSQRTAVGTRELTKWLSGLSVTDYERNLSDENRNRALNDVFDA